MCKTVETRFAHTKNNKMYSDTQASSVDLTWKDPGPIKRP